MLDPAGEINRKHRAVTPSGSRNELEPFPAVKWTNHSGGRGRAHHCPTVGIKLADRIPTRCIYSLYTTKPFTPGLVWRRNTYGKHVAGFIAHSVTSQLGLTKPFTAGLFLAAQQFRWLNLLYTVSLYCTQCHFTVGLDKAFTAGRTWDFLYTSQLGLFSGTGPRPDRVVGPCCALFPIGGSVPTVP